MKKDLAATISSSMRFYSEEVDRLDILNCPLFSKIYEPTTEPINFAPMTEEQKLQQHESLLEKHKTKMRKSNYLIVINKDGYIGDGVKEEIEYANEIGLGILYTEYPSDIECLGTLCWHSNTYYLSAPDTHYMEDAITEHTDFILMPYIKKIKLAAVPGIPNINGYQYEEESLIKALNNEKMKELFSTNNMKVEFGSSKGKAEFMSIDLIKAVGQVLVVGKKYLFIKANDTYNEVFSDDTELIAYMRYTAHTIKKEEEFGISIVDIKAIITWDIWYNELSNEYLKTIS